MRNAKLFFWFLIWVWGISPAYSAELRDDFRNGIMENTTLSNVPGAKYKKNLASSLKLSSQGFEFKPRDWEPLPKEITGGATPEFADIDNDGDIDLVIGYNSKDKPIDIFENIGNKYKPVFRKKKEIHIDNWYGKITLGDYNSDGKQDIGVIYNKEEVHFYKNTGGINFERDASWDIKDIPLPPFIYDLTLELGDLDYDNDPDLILFYIEQGTKTGDCYNLKFLAYENTGNSFIRKSNWDPISLYNISLGVGWNTSLELVDLDNNQTPDLVFTCTEEGNPQWYKNIGTQSFPVWYIPYQKYPYQLYFSKYEFVKYGDSGLSFLTGDILFGSAGFGDLDSDGDLDMLMGAPDQFCIAFENIGFEKYSDGTNIPIFTIYQRTHLKGFHVTGGIAFADFDDDRDYDQVLLEGINSCMGPSLGITLNKGNPEDARFYYCDYGFSLMKFERYLDSRPIIGDLDNDGKLDIMEAEYRDAQGRSAIGAFRNVSTETLGFEYYPSWNITGDFLVSQGLKSSYILDLWPFLIDLNNDKKYDIILSVHHNFLFLQNIGTQEVPKFIRNKEWETSTDFTILYPQGETYAMPVSADLDGDNLEDLLVATNMPSYIFAFKRIGTDSVLFERRKDWEDKLNAMFKPNDAPLGFLDYDNDGDYDLVIAYTGSGPALYLNIGSHNTTGTYTSTIFDAGAGAIFSSIFFDKREKPNTSLKVFIRYGNSTQTLTNWSEVSNGQSLNITARYIQYQARLSTEDPEYTPILYDVIIPYNLGNTRIDITPIEGPIGTILTITGGGFSSNENIRIDFGTTRTITSKKADSNGSFSTTFIVNTQTQGLVPVTATGISSKKTAINYFLLTSISNPSIKLTKNAILQGNTITYTITYKNEGKGKATDVNIIEVLPQHCVLKGIRDEGVGISYYVNGKWQTTFSESATKIKWLIPEVSPASSGTVSFTVKVE